MTQFKIGDKVRFMDSEYVLVIVGLPEDHPEYFGLHKCKLPDDRGDGLYPASNLRKLTRLELALK